MSTGSLKSASWVPSTQERPDIDGIILEMLATWDEDYLCGCSLYQTPS